MRLKQRTALLLAGVMMVCAVGIINPTEAKAAGATNTFTLTVPADTNFSQSGWNAIGDVKIQGSIDYSKKITIGITTTNGSKLKNGSNEIAYTIKKASTDTEATTGFDLWASAVNTTGGATQALGAVVDATQFSNATAGTYEDTINFTATLVTGDVTYTCTGTNANSKVLKASEMMDAGNTSTFTYNSVEYTAYNGYISSTACANWNDAQAFVAALNSANYDGYNDWTLLSNKDMAFDWWQSMGDENATLNTSGVKKLVIHFDQVLGVWTTDEYNDLNDNDAYFWHCGEAGEVAFNNWGAAGIKSYAMNLVNKSLSENINGFVVLRGSSSN